MKRAGKTFALLLATTVIVLGHISAASGETFYRWKDERGNPVHSDRPPPKGIPYDVVSTDTSLIRRVQAEAGAVPKRVTPTPSNDFKPAETNTPMMEKNPEYCARAQENLRLIDTSPRIKLRNDQGEVRFLDDEERAVERQKALDGIAAHCE